MDINDYPFVEVGIPGERDYQKWYEVGQQWRALWPGQDADEFAEAIASNDPGPLANLRDGTDRHLAWSGRRRTLAHYFARGACDYTGWDCQSDLEFRSWNDTFWLASQRKEVWG